MTRRTSRRTAAAHHAAMLTAEQSRIHKTRRHAARRHRNHQIALAEAVLCPAFTDVTVGADTRHAVRPLGSAVVLGGAGGGDTGDVNMRSVPKVKRVRKDKKAERRRKKIRERQQNRAAMVM